MTRIAVVIPVGPEEHHARWLDECLQSVAEQTRAPDFIVIVDDMHGGGFHGLDAVFGPPAASNIEVYSPPWHLGVATAFNVGVALAHQEGCDLALMLGADDRLEPRVLERLVQKYEGEGKRDGFYWLEVQYQSGEQQALPCNAAAMTPGFMRATGGLPVEASLGGMDAALVSALLVHAPDMLIHVPGQHESRVWVRQHEHQEGARLASYGQEAILAVRNVFTRDFRQPTWGRFA